MGPAKCAPSFKRLKAKLAHPEPCWHYYSHNSNIPKEQNEALETASNQSSPSLQQYLLQIAISHYNGWVLVLHRRVINQDLFQNIRATIENQTNFSFSTGLSSHTCDPFLTSLHGWVMPSCTLRDPETFCCGCISDAGMKSTSGAAGWEELRSKHRESWKEWAGLTHDFSTHFCKSFRPAQTVWELPNGRRSVFITLTFPLQI